MKEDYSTFDIGLRFRGHPILVGSHPGGRPVGKHLLISMDKYLKQVLPKDLIEILTDHSTGCIIKGAS